MRKPEANTQRVAGHPLRQKKAEIEQLSQADLVELVLGLRKIIQELQEKLAIANRPPAKVFIRSFHTNHFKDYLLIIKDWLNTLTNIGSVDRSRTFARGLMVKVEPTVKHHHSPLRSI